MGHHSNWASPGLRTSGPQVAAIRRIGLMLIMTLRDLERVLYFEKLRS